MNKIYKVIWNKTRGMYMVVSELAKGQSKDGRRAVGRKKVAQTAAALAVFFSIVSMGGTSFAADTGITKVESSTSGTAVEVYTKDGTDSKAAELDTRITNVKKYLEKQTSENYVSKTDAAVQDAGVVKANKKIGENVTALGKGLYDETAARIGADAAQDKVIQAVNDNLVQSVTTINKNVADGFNALNTADANEAKARTDADAAEKAAREAGDTALNTRITNVKEYLEQQTSDKYVSKADAAVQDGAIVKANKTIGDNVTKLDAALASETAARIGADKAQDKVIQTVNDNLVQSVNTINQNMSAGFNALSQADANELAGRVAADAKLVEAVNSGLSLNNDNVLQKNTTTIDAQGNVTTSKTDANEMILNKGKDNQITLNKNGIKVGTNSTVVDKDGVYTGGDTYSEAKAALKSDGSIKGADGKFTVDGTNGNVSTKGSLTAASGTIGNVSMSADGTMTGVKDLTASGKITADSFTDGTATMSNGSLNGVNQINATGNIVTTGNMKAHDITAEGTIKGETINGTTGTFGSLSTTGNASVGGTLTTNGITNTGNATTDTLIVNHNATVGGNLAVTGDITGKSLNVGTGDIKGGQITGTGLDVGAGTIKTTGATETGTLKTTGKAEIGDDLSVAGNTEMKGNLDVKGDLSVEGEFNAKTLSSKLDENNYTIINGGKTQSMNLKMNAATGETQASASTFDETGSNMWAKDDDSIGKSTVTADSISQKLSNTGDNPTAYAERAMSQGTDNKYSMTDTVKDGDKTNVASQSATESSDVITEGSGDSAKTSTFRQKIDQILQEIKTSDEIYSKIDQTVNKMNSTVRDGANSTSVEQGTQDITHTAKQGTISNTAKDLVNTAAENMTNTVGKDLTTTVGGNETHYVAGNQTNTVSGDRTVNVKGTEKENFNAQVTNVKTDQKTSVGGNQTNIVGGDQQNTVSGSKLETVKGSVTEKYGSQATTIDGDQSTHVGGNQENVVTGNQTNTISGNKTETVKGAVNETYGSQTTKVNGDQSTTVTGKQTNSITGDQVNTIGGSQTTTVTGDVTEDYKANLSTTVGGNQTTTVTGDSSLTAENITNTATEKLSNAAAEIENSASKSITDKVGANVERTMTTKKISESVKDGTKSNSFSKTAEKDINIIADGTNTSTLSQLADSVNTSLKNGTQSLNNTKTVTEDVTKVTDKNTGAFSSSSQKADAMTNTVKNGSKSNTVTEKASTSEQKLVSGNIIDILKDAENGYVNTTVRSGTGDDATSTSVKQGTADITSTATTSIKDVVGKSTVTTTDTGTTFENSDHAAAIGEGSITQTTISGNTLETGKVTADYVDVNKDLNVKGSTKLDGTLEVAGKSTFKDAVSMDKDLTVAGDVSASSYKVADKTYINQSGLNANNQKVTNVADGDVAEGSKDAVNGGQLHATNQRVSTVENRVDRVETRVDNLDNRIDKVGANAAAMANLHPMDFDEDSKVSVAAAVGNYRSETAGALGVFYRPTDRVMMNVSTSFGNGENMIGGGVSFKLGKSSKRLEKAEATNAALVKQVTNLQNRLDALLGVLNPNLSKAFPDVPANHWAYEAVSRLAGNDIIQGYEDGKYHGERTMTRYEMAEIIYNALSKGAKAEAKLVEEFRPELQAMAAQRKA
ncbi:Coiled stalk of trimeric autotransporter adhesin [Acidaminococcus fermentans]|uniref:ESPR-type extended signal peptide-containing protein n=1 Tax=Acidaminococcus fermentans TaxID=905 RepID=UPI0008E9D18A|nr:ESPR-type extended signal peptide-containing protein [Acidaminococcus fermentans]SFO78399.1 Coiled stalk of trimeric autotransporter adhesin [Acidaminococcus fermentans]